MNIFKKQKHFISPARAEVREYRVRLMEKRRWWAWPLMPFLHELSELIMSCLPPRNNFQNIFSYRGWGSEGDKMSFPWSGENHINLQLNRFSCSKPSIYFIKPMPASFFYTVPSTYGGQSNDLLFALNSVSIDWVSSCVPLNLISTWLLSIWTTGRQRAAGGGTAGQLWTCEKGQGPASLSLQLSLKFLPAYLLLFLATLVCCGLGEGLLVTLEIVLNC